MLALEREGHTRGMSSQPPSPPPFFEDAMINSMADSLSASLSQ